MNIKSLSKGMVVEEKFGIISKDRKVASNGKPYLTVEMSHSTGNIKGKVWDDNFAEVEMEVGKVAIVKAIVDSFGGYFSLNIKEAHVVGEDNINGFVRATPTLVFDIETAGKDFEELEEWDQDYLLGTLEKYGIEKEEGSEEAIKTAKEKTGLYPLYGQVVSIGMFNPESDKGIVLTQGKGEVKIDDEKFSCEVFKSEKELLVRFWQLHQKYERFVTFNGVGFDYPFLIIRSGINKVKVPTEIKFYGDEHIDLMKKFASGRTHFKLEALCRAFGITNPKEKGVSGLHVSQLWRDGKIKEVADYVSRDAVSTSQLYVAWKEFMAGKLIV